MMVPQTIFGFTNGNMIATSFAHYFFSDYEAHRDFRGGVRNELTSKPPPFDAIIFFQCIHSCKAKARTFKTIDIL